MSNGKGGRSYEEGSEDPVSGWRWLGSLSSRLLLPDAHHSNRLVLHHQSTLLARFRCSLRCLSKGLGRCNLLDATMSGLRVLRNCDRNVSGSVLQKATVASVKTHTMGSSLHEYLRMKVHPDIQSKRWSRIVVRGEHQRKPSTVRISCTEEKDKPFDWQRPTSSTVGSKTLQLHCFPGVDYVRHYAAITATYLSLTGGQEDIQVQYQPPSQRE